MILWHPPLLQPLGLCAGRLGFAVLGTGLINKKDWLEKRSLEIRCENSERIRQLRYRRPDLIFQTQRTSPHPLSHSHYERKHASEPFSCAGKLATKFAVSEELIVVRSCARLPVRRKISTVDRTPPSPSSGESRMWKLAPAHLCSYTMKSDGIKTVQIYHNLPTYRPVNVVSGSSIVFDFTTSSSVAGPWFRDVVPSASYSSSVASFTIGVANAKQNNQQVVESAASSSIMSSGFIVVAVLAMLGIFSVPRGSIAVYALCALFLASVVVAQTCNITEVIFPPSLPAISETR